MRWHSLTLFLCIIGVGLITGCSGKSSSELKALKPYTQATLTAGTGLRDLKLGQTTLGEFVHKIGSGTVSVIMGDDSAIELTFLNGEASFLFIVSGACQTETGGPGARLEINQDVKAFLARHPGCNNVPLASLSVAIGNSRDDTFFKGRTDQGVQLWSPKAEADRHGVRLNNAGQLVAGESATDDTLGRLEYPGGIYFYYPIGKGSTPAEQVSGQALSPERLREIEESAKAAAKNPVIQRMTIFIPNR